MREPIVVDFPCNAKHTSPFSGTSVSGKEGKPDGGALPNLGEHMSLLNGIGNFVEDITIWHPGSFIVTSSQFIVSSGTSSHPLSPILHQQSMAQPEVGFVGLGAMGGGMAKQLVAKGFPVSCYDIYPPSIEKLVQAGGKAATSPADAARAADMLVIMVVGPGQVSAVLFDKGTGAVHGLRQNAVIIITSTVPPEFCEEVQDRLHSEFGRRDITLLDCPVSGGTTGAAAGTLTIFSSGPDDGLDKAQPVLKGMGTKLCRIPGGIGYGSKAKMCHQIPPEVQIALSNEVMAFAAKAGLNTQATFDAVQASDGWSWVNGNRIPHMLEGDKSVYSAVPNSLKDSVSSPF